MLRSVLAQIRRYSEQGVPFDKHLHVPEANQYSDKVVCQREDEGHIFKVCRLHHNAQMMCALS